MDIHLLSNLPALNAIKLGNLYYKSKGIEAITAKMVRPAASEYVAEEPMIGLIGSSTLLRNSKGMFVACTRHQLNLADVRPFKEDHVAHVRFTSYESGILANIPTDGVQFITDNVDEEFSDLLLFKVARDWKGSDKERPYFALLKQNPQMPRRKSWLVGFPSNQNKVIEEDKKFNSVCRIVGCTFDENYKTTNRFFRRYKLNQSETSLDGFSGGAVFSLFGDVGNMMVLIDGLIVRGGSDWVYAISPAPILRLASAF
jgi:hypothetical protein